MVSRSAALLLALAAVALVVVEARELTGKSFGFVKTYEPFIIKKEAEVKKVVVVEKKPEEKVVVVEKEPEKKEEEKKVVVVEKEEKKEEEKKEVESATAEAKTEVVAEEPKVEEPKCAPGEVLASDKDGKIFCEGPPEKKEVVKIGCDPGFEAVEKEDGGSECKKVEEKVEEPKVVATTETQQTTTATATTETTTVGTTEPAPVVGTTEATAETTTEPTPKCGADEFFFSKVESGGAGCKPCGGCVPGSCKDEIGCELCLNGAPSSREDPEWPLVCPTDEKKCPDGQFFFNKVESGGAGCKVCKGCPAEVCKDGIGCESCPNGGVRYKEDPEWPYVCPT